MQPPRSRSRARKASRAPATAYDEPTNLLWEAHQRLVASLESQEVTLSAQRLHRHLQPA